MHNYTVNRNN